MSNTFGTDIIIQSEDPEAAARFYVEQLGFEITGRAANLISIHGPDINFFVERGPRLGPVFELHVGDVAAAKARLLAQGCKVIKDEPGFPRCYMQDPHGLMYNLAP
ncbi:MAG TPA: VOC family protein [Rhizomicrobium sp.]|jgi:catechol 2,3-dioxygenase-like lactoylglutathione lyase family enzyme|nr:VOC family protein [Rhizomicrobium sp.]